MRYKKTYFPLTTMGISGAGIWNIGLGNDTVSSYPRSDAAMSLIKLLRFSDIGVPPTELALDITPSIVNKLADHLGYPDYIDAPLIPNIGLGIRVSGGFDPADEAAYLADIGNFVVLGYQLDVRHVALGRYIYDGKVFDCPGGRHSVQVANDAYFPIPVHSTDLAPSQPIPDGAAIDAGEIIYPRIYDK